MAFRFGGRPVVVTDDLKLYYDFLNPKCYPGTGTSITDLSTNGNNGTLQASLSVTGSYINCDGTNDYVSTTIQEALPSAWTFSLWMKTTETRGRKLIGAENLQTGNLSTGYNRHMYINTSGQIVHGYYSTTYRTVTSTAAYNDDEWHNIVGVVGAPAEPTNGIRLYVDGVSVASTTAAAAPPALNQYYRIASYKLGAWAGGSDGFFAGQIAVAKIYHRSLYASEVLRNYNAYRGRFGK